ncbi:hypothetical protein [Bacillus suaedae]|uniref:Uncharacterized protein n=1 Tax=Halalkalibacter suaedae TaxID=2822140 RepID=A0A940WNB4_9BACI|nr:hypothetical protein [Bacillus suaedae]MBP3949550.1 hypothetical protein [Bacillus suaedae]
MSEFIIIITVLLFSVTILATSRFFYLLEIRQTNKKLMHKLNIDILELNYSFEQMVFFYSLPSIFPTIKNAHKKDLIIEFDYQNHLFQQLSGINVFIKSDKEKLLLAYLPTNDFRLPSLDLLLQQGKIDETEYNKISIFKLIHPKTLQEIKDEVYKQIRVGRYEKIE